MFNFFMVIAMFIFAVACKKAWAETFPFSKSIFVVTANKGGVGKSLLSFSLIDYLVSKGKKVRLLELDENNPDVARAFTNNPLVTITPVKTETQDDWDRFGDLILVLKDQYIVVNIPGDQKDKIMDFMGLTLNDIAQDKEHGFNFFTFWPMARQLDSYEDFLAYVPLISESYLFPVLNEHSGRSDLFEFLSDPKYKDIRKEVKSRGGILTMPSLNDIVAGKIRTEGHPDSVQLLRTQRLYWVRWKQKMEKILDPVFKGLL